MPHADSYHPGHVEDFLHARGLKHLRARKHGAAVIVESGPVDDPVKHIRLRRDTVHLWLLDIADHRGRWERTPFRDQIDNLLATVAQTFPWVLSPVAPENSDRTSGGKY